MVWSPRSHIGYALKSVTPTSIVMPPTTARARPTTAPHGIASHTFCDVLFCEIWAATAESLVSLDESLPRELALAGVVALSLGVPVMPLIFAIILSSFASRLKGFSMEGMGHDLDMCGARSCASVGNPKVGRAADLRHPKVG